ncbi:MAG: hypothetical protein PVH50_01570 [Anaerolineae bacterium]
MGRKIFRSGDSAVASILPEALAALGLELGDELTVTADPERERIVLTPAASPGVRPGFRHRMDQFIERCQPALEAGPSEPWQRSTMTSISPSRKCICCMSG